MNSKPFCKVVIKHSTEAKADKKDSDLFRIVSTQTDTAIDVTVTRSTKREISSSARFKCVVFF